MGGWQDQEGEHLFSLSPTDCLPVGEVQHPLHWGMDNRKCLPMDSKNLGKMGVSYNKPLRASRSGSQGGSASHNTQPSTSGAGDQEVDSHHQAGPSTSRGPRGSAATRTLISEVIEELVFRLPDALMAPFQAQVDRSFRKLHHRVKRVKAQLGRVEAKLDLLLANQHLTPNPDIPPPPPPPRPPHNPDNNPPPPPPSPHHNSDNNPPSPPLRPPLQDPPLNDSPDRHQSHTSGHNQSPNQDSPYHHQPSDHSSNHSHHSSHPPTTHLTMMTMTHPLHLLHQDTAQIRPHLSPPPAPPWPSHILMMPKGGEIH